MIPVTGLIAGGIDDWNNYSWSVYTDIDGLKEQLKKAFKKGNRDPGQPTNKKGKPLNYIVYNSAEVFVDDMEHVAQVQKILADKGYQVNSQMDWLESSDSSPIWYRQFLGALELCLCL